MRRSLALALLVSTSLTLTTTSAWGDTTPDYLGIGIARSAEAEGVAVSTIESAARNQDATNAAIQQMAEKYPKFFVAARLEPSIVYFTNSTPDSVLGEAYMVHGLLSNRIGDWNEASYESFAADVSDGLDSAGLEAASYMVIPEPTFGLIDVILPAADSTGATINAATVAAEVEALGYSTAQTQSLSGTVYAESADRDIVPTPDVARPGVVIHTATGFSAEAATIRGGNALSTCTAGFTAKYGSYYGVTTAAHCGNTQLMDGRDVLHPATPAHSPADGDIQYHRGKEAVSNTFRYDWGVFRPATRNVKAAYDTRLCKFGKSSGAACSRHARSGVCVRYLNDPNKYCKMSITKTRAGVTAGDSGGPWYYGQNAYGITSGWTADIISPTIAVYTPTYTGFPSLGVTLKTS